MAYYAMVTMSDGFVDRSEVIAAVQEALARPLAVLTGKVDREAWMRSPQAQAGQRAMMRATGGAAPMRPPEAKRPEAWKARDAPE